MQDWPYPKLFCHRLGGALGPENTLGAMQKAIALGVRAVECDVKLSADRVPFVLHDDTLERTTNGQGLAGALSMSALLALDAGISHHPAFAGEPLPTLARLAEQALAHQLAVNLEIKPNPGQDQETATLVAQQAAQLWQASAIAPLLSSFSYNAVLAARQAAPALPRAWLVEDIPVNVLDKLAACQASALHVNWQALTVQWVEKLHAAGYRVMAYTVNQPTQAQTLLAWGVDMICTDRPDLLGV